MSHNIPECFKMSQNILKCPKMSWSVPECPVIFNYVLKCPRMSQKVRACVYVLFAIKQLLLYTSYPNYNFGHILDSRQSNRPAGNVLVISQSSKPQKTLISLLIYCEQLFRKTVFSGAVSNRCHCFIPSEARLERGRERNMLLLSIKGGTSIFFCKKE